MISLKQNNILTYKELVRMKPEGLEHPSELKILVADDNVFDLELILRQLQKQSKIKLINKTVTNKQAYEEAIKTFLPDVVFCDYSISYNFNAIDAVRILKYDYPEVPFVLVTGALDEEFASVCIKEGIDDYLLKSNLSRLPLSLINLANKRKVELQKKEAYEKLVKSEIQIRNFAQHLNKTLEEERAHLAREMHDELGQQMASVKIGISLFKKQNNIKFDSLLDRLQKEIDSTIQSMRKIATELRPGILDTLGLIPSIKWLATEFEKKNYIKCSLDCNIEDIKYGQDISICFFRICQEALTNIHKHSQASEVHISIEQVDEYLMLKITDNGIGIENEKLENPFSMGLLGMRERAAIVNASLIIEKEKTGGTTVTLSAKIN